MLSVSNFSDLKINYISTYALMQFIDFRLIDRRVPIVAKHAAI